MVVPYLVYLNPGKNFSYPNVSDSLHISLRIGIKFEENKEIEVIQLSGNQGWCRIWAYG
jgi:hypothetical protein